MPGNKIETSDQVIAITDPGEVGRDEHLWGDRLMIGVGNIFAWLFPLLMIAIVTQVFIRRLGFNQAWLDEAQWWMYGAAMVAGFGYAITTDSHVRVDIFHQNYSPERKAKLEVFGLGWMLIPFMIMMTDVLIHYAVASWKAWEGSDSPNGLHMLFLLKTALPILFVAAIVAASAALLRNARKWKGRSALWTGWAAFPAIWFVCERLIFYALFWVFTLANPDLSSRDVTKLGAVSNSFWWGLIATVALIGFFHMRGNQKREAV